MKRMLSTLFLLITLPATAQTVTLTIDTWGYEAELWKDTIIPAFKRHYPNIDIEFNQVSNQNYEDDVEQRLANKADVDLVICKPFDGSLGWFNNGYLEEITEMAGMENYPSFALAAWQTDSGAKTYCLPVGAVIHGFLYNKTIFDKLGLQEPVTRSEFFNLLERIQLDGRYQPMAFGTKDGWDVNEVGFQNIGPNYWRGEDGRLGLINGTERFDSEAYRQVFSEMKSWIPFLDEEYRELGYRDYLTQFADGKAAIVPAGSWEIVNLKDKVDLGVFAPPVPDGQSSCYFSEHTDKGIGINRNSPYKKEAMLLLKWMTTKEFASLFTQAETGFFSLSNHFYEVADPTARKMASWRYRCDSTIRSFAQKLARGEPRFDSHLAQVSAAVLNGTIEPEQATKEIQKGLDSWYQPQKVATEAYRTRQQGKLCY